MLFSEIIGQQALKEQLIHTAQIGRISHARLFLGPDGAGGLPLAIAYAQYINCAAPTATDSCGVCPSCRKYAKLAHPDLHFVFPIIKGTDSKPVVCDMFIKQWREALTANPYLTYRNWLEVLNDEKKQPLIYEAESGEVLRKLSLKAYEAPYKVMIIWMAETMNESMSNKVLKILEEPFDRTLFLLVSAAADQMLPTILSRTQITRVPKIDTASLTEYLKGRCTEQQAIDAARMSEGTLYGALSYLSASEEDNLFFDLFVRMMRLCWAVWGRKQEMLALAQWSKEVAAFGRPQMVSFLTYSIRMIRENFALTCEQPSLARLNAKEADFSSRFHAFIHAGNVAQIAEELERAINHVDANGNAEIIIFDMACKIVLLLRPLKQTA